MMSSIKLQLSCAQFVVQYTMGRSLFYALHLFEETEELFNMAKIKVQMCHGIYLMNVVAEGILVVEARSVF